MSRIFSSSQSSPGIYTNVAEHLDWIEKEVKANGGMATCSGLLSVPPTLGNIPFFLLLCSQKLNIQGVPKNALQNCHLLVKMVNSRPPHQSGIRELTSGCWWMEVLKLRFFWTPCTLMYIFRFLSPASLTAWPPSVGRAVFRQPANC